MIKKIFIFPLLLFSIAGFSQKELVHGYIITEAKDTIWGDLKNKDYFKARKIRLLRDSNTISYNKKSIAEIHVNHSNYVKSDCGIWAERFFIKKFTGSVNVYTKGNKSYLGVYDSDLHFGRVNTGIAFFCDDYPNFSDSARFVSARNMQEFVVRYNEWKKENSGSMSYYQRNMHEKKFVNFKVDLILPGIGSEFGLSDKFTVNSMLQIEHIGFNGITGFIIIPILNNQLRYYHNIDNRIRKNIRTYKYSGNYLCLAHSYNIYSKTAYYGLGYGWQRSVGKNWYYNLGGSIVKQVEYTEQFNILLDLHFGYNF